MELTISVSSVFHSSVFALLPSSSIAGCQNLDDSSIYLKLVFLHHLKESFHKARVVYPCSLGDLGIKFATQTISKQWGGLQFIISEQEVKTGD